jgi:transcriptional regulator with XRE-family HTH domain
MRNFQKQKVPPKRTADGMAIHPIVRWIWDQINFQHASQEDIAKRSGVSSSAMRKWRDGVRSPRLMELEAVVNALGFKIKVVMQEDK